MVQLIVIVSISVEPLPEPDSFPVWEPRLNNPVDQTDVIRVLQQRNGHLGTDSDIVPYSNSE